MNRNASNIPVDFSELDVRFLQYYLTAERVGIEWEDTEYHKLIMAKNMKEFFVGVNFIKGHDKYDETIPHSISFMRLPNKNSKTGHDMQSEFIVDIYGLGAYNMESECSMNDVIKNKLAIFRSIFRDYPNWINHRGFFQALDDFNHERKE
jgi:hypothetical protein